MTKTAGQQIMSALGRRKSPVTVKEIAAKTGINPNTAKSAIQKLEEDGFVQVTGTAQTGKRGRPANLYKAA